MTESHKEIAARIVKDYSWDPALIEGAILAALHNERERCARIVMEKHENHPQDGDSWDGTFYDLAESIRAS